MSGSLRYVSEVQKIDSSGNATVHTVVEDSSLTATWMGQPIPMTLQLPPVTTRMAPTGKILSCTVATSASQQLPSLGLSGTGAATQAFDLTKFFGTTQNAGFPRQPISPGTEWSDTATITTAEGSKINVSSTSKLLGLVTYRGRQCAKISTTFSVPLSMQMAQEGLPFVLSGSDEGTVTTYFALAEGRMIGSVGKTHTNMTMGTGLPGVGTGMGISVSIQCQTDVRVALVGTTPASRSTAPTSR
jgi:hypothetical protein